MPRFSRPIIIDGKQVGVMCGRSPDKKCSSCGGFGGERLCDYPVTNGKTGTCDRALCKSCAVRVAPNTDYCPAHHRLSQEAKAP